MTANPRKTGRVPGLMDRRAERDALGVLVDAVRSGESRALVVRGDPGVGKTVLVDHLAGRASGSGCRVARAPGVQSEMELAFAGLHQLCAPMLGHLDGLPGPQQDALRTAFGLAAGPPPDRFFVALAVLSLLSEVAAERPLICVIDDEQWLDRASAQALGFVARRLAAEPVGLVFAAREPGSELAGLPELEVDGLRDADARALLASVLAGPLDARVRDLIIAETRGNPLALLELPRGLTPAELAGGFGLPGATPLAGRIEDSFARQLDALPEQARRLLLVAAADPSGDRPLVWRAASRLGIAVQEAGPAVEAGLVAFGASVRFRHPLVRSAAYRSASLSERQQVHAALAEVTDAIADPDRRAWHRAQAAAGPDEDVAAELERSAGRAQARGGMAAAAAFLERSVLLTADPARHAERMLAAAQASMQAGAFGKALELLDRAEAEPLEELQSARADLLRGHVTFASGMGSDAPPLLLRAAQRLEPLDLALARQAYLDAWLAAVFTGRLAAQATLLEVCRAARRLPSPGDRPGKPELVLDALTLLVTDGPGVAAPALRTAMDAFTAADVTAEERLRLNTFAEGAAIALWDLDAWRALVERQAATVRAVGALGQLPLVLVGLGATTTWAGDLTASAALVAESDTVCEATGAHAPPFAALMLACLRGREAEAVSLVEATIAGATAGGQGLTVGYANWVAAILYNSLGHYEQALAAATQSSQDAAMYVSLWALPELIEAAVRSGNADLAAGPMARLAESTQAGGTDFGLGIESRCRALLGDGDTAERLYREAIERLARTRYRPDLARAHLLYGEWLRQDRRRTNARAQLRIAHDMFDTIGMEAFASRAGRELRATGETVHSRTVRAPGALTAHEASIARLARDGLTNPEIGAQLFLSARTVEWHLRKIFTKLDIGSRRELRAALARLGPDGQTA
jgi:DNA-binding CsgD family transcriptional regulator/tetratricopeptide (TPR) repeat protein